MAGIKEVIGDLLQRPDGGVFHAGVRPAHRLDPSIFLLSRLFLDKQKRKKEEQKVRDNNTYVNHHLLQHIKSYHAKVWRKKVVETCGKAAIMSEICAGRRQPQQFESN